MSPLLVYALLDASPARLEPGLGMGGEPLRVVPIAGTSAFAALVGEVDAAPAIAAEALRAYDQTLRRVSAQVEALLPMRFGTRVAGLAELDGSLAPRRVELEEALARVRAREQVTMRVYQERPSPEAVAGEGPGARYLRSRARAAAPPELPALHAALASLVCAERVQVHAAPPLVASVFHLIPRGRSASYREVVAGCAPPEGVTVRVSGPWPPYAFADHPRRDHV